jgi:predicted type IV restriction endonuclease
MPYIPKKVVTRFGATVPKFQKVLSLAKDRDVNESDTVEILTDILEAAFGYDKYLELTSEYRIRGRYCDIAVKINDKVQYLMEAKAVGIDLKENHIRQAVDYAANYGVQWVILTNGIEWRLYRLRFEKPIDYDLVHSFEFLSLNPKKKQDQEQLFLLSREGLDKDAREEFYEKVQIVNRFVIGHLMLAEPVLKLIKRELRKASEGVKVDLQEVEQIIRSEVLRRNLVEGDEADEAQKVVSRLYKKSSTPSRRRTKKPAARPKKEERGSLSDRLLADAGESDQSTTQQSPSSDSGKATADGGPTGAPEG